MQSMEKPIKDKEYLVEYANALKIIQTAVNVQEQLSEESIQKASELAASFGYDAQRFEKITHRIKQKLEL